jgi:hypothetical protein
MVTVLDARARDAGAVIRVSGTSAFTRWTIAWPTAYLKLVLDGNPSTNSGRVLEFTSEDQVNALLGALYEEAEGRGIEVGRIHVLTTFLQTTMLNTLQHGGGRGHAALCMGLTAAHACVCDAGPGIADTFAARVADPQEAVSIVVNGTKHGGLMAVANSAYRYPGSSFTLRSGSAEVQLGADSGESQEAPQSRQRAPVRGTYAALSVPHGTSQ